LVWRIAYAITTFSNIASTPVSSKKNEAPDVDEKVNAFDEFLNKNVKDCKDVRKLVVSFVSDSLESVCEDICTVKNVINHQYVHLI